MLSARILIVLLLFNSALFAERKIPADTASVYALLIEASQLEKADPDSAMQLARLGYRLSQDLDYQKGIGMAFMRMASVLSDRGSNGMAITYTRQALHIREKLNDLSGVGSASAQLAYIFNLTGQRDSAFYYHFRALHAYEATADSAAIAGAYTDLGRLLSDYGEKDKALPYLKKALDIFLRLDDPESTSAAWSNLGDFYFRSGDFGTALELYRHAKDEAARSGNMAHLANADNNLALCYANLKEYEVAWLHYARALDFYSREDFKNDVALTSFNLGILFDNMGMSDSALYYLHRSYDVATSVAHAAYAASALKYLAYVYARKGDFIKAYGYHVEYAQLSDSLLNTEKVKQIANMQTRYETEKKEQQIVLLDAQGKARSAQRNFFIAGTIVLLLALVALGIYYRQRSRLAKKNAEIAQRRIDGLLNEQEIKSYNAMIEGQEEERKRIASDLHDRLGSMLSTVKLLFASLDSKIDKAQAEQQQQYERVNTLLDEAVSEVRRVSHNLSTGMVMSFGLLPALDELCDSINKSGLIRCTLQWYGMEERLDQQTEIGLYRMIQELMSNILKHAAAKEVSIQLNVSEGSLSVTVEDNGVGFDAAAKKHGGGMGLKNLHARAEKLGGTYHVDSKPGAGTVSIIEIPVKKQP